MARQRKNVNTSNNTVGEVVKKTPRQNRNGTSSSSAGSETPEKPITDESRFVVMTQWRIAFGCCCLAIASYFCYQGYLETRVNTPFDNQKMVHRAGLDYPERYWGSYRPGTYFGLKTRDPHSIVTGLMWYNSQNRGNGGNGIRHWCEIGDKLQKYGWNQHDGLFFGIQEIQDDPFTIETSFVKRPFNKFGGDWSARIHVNSKEEYSKDQISLIWYIALDEKTEGSISIAEMEKPIPGIFGSVKGLEQFKLTFHTVNGTVLQHSYLSTVAPSLQYLRETLDAYSQKKNLPNGKKKYSLPGEILLSQTGEKLNPNFIAVEITAETPFTLDISYQTLSESITNDIMQKQLIGTLYTTTLNEKFEDFNIKFDKIFNLHEKGYSLDEIKFAQAALSNMIGGIGYFHGSSKVQSIYTKQPVPYWRGNLYTAVPSRSFFPRGFLWDEGFHGLLITEWDVDIELDIICHWFDLMNVEGWIPREQILGIEALAKVPQEFVIQKNTNANPPTFFLTLKKIITKYRKQLSLNQRLSTLERLYPRLQAWFSWYNTTQKGEILGTYRWRGRNSNDNKELNPKTLTSGLDDFPRASHPNDKERHIDLHCWITFAAGVMADLSILLGHDDLKYWETFSYLSNEIHLNKYYLSIRNNTYTDWGLHTDGIILKRGKATTEQISKNQQADMIRFTYKTPKFDYIDTTFGYVNLFPFLLEILPVDSPNLLRIFQNIYNPNILWTNYGLRSLSKNSPLYMKRNTEHDPPYWRGQIWININYLVLKALNYYANIPGPYKDNAKIIYNQLRKNLITNIFNEYKRTGYIWEQYNDKTGKGSGCYPFTGWSSLVVLIMSEKY